MISLTGIKIKTTTYPEPAALQSFYSYTLSCTPFYFKLQWLTGDEEYKSHFSNKQILWDFGDGEYHTGETAIHYYKWPGNYIPQATIYDTEGNSHTIQVDNVLKVYNAIPDIVTIGGIDKGNRVAYPIQAGKRSPRLEIYRYNSWQYNDYLNGSEYTVNLYASGSNSSFMSVSSYYSSSWSHLKSYFSFVQEYINESGILETKLIESTKTNSVSMYAERVDTGFKNNDWSVKLNFYPYYKQGTIFCGTSGTVPDNYSVKFVDQKPSNSNKFSFTALYGSTDTSIFKNEDYAKYNYNSHEPYGFVNVGWSTIFVKSLFNPASSIKITSNGISVEGPTRAQTLTAQELYSFDLYPIKFTNTKIPFVITLKDSQDYTTKCYPKLNFNINSLSAINDVNISLVSVSLSGNDVISTAKFSPNSSVPSFNKSGSYFAGTLVSEEEVKVAAISAIAYIQDDPIPIPNRNYGFVLQPGCNLFRRVENVYRYGYFNDSNSFDVGTESKITTFKAPVSGGVNVTYVPGTIKSTLSSDRVWITNSSNDAIYCFDNNGTMDPIWINLKKFRFIRIDPTGKTISSLIDATENTKSAAPCNIAADSNGDIWVTLRDCVSSFKFDKLSKRCIASIVLSPEFINEEWYGSYLYSLSGSTLSGFVGENSILPTSVDVDKNDNVYITYSHPLSSFVVKYGPDGSQNSIIPLPVAYPHTVKQIMVDIKDNLWITTFNNSSIGSQDGLGQTQKITDRIDYLCYINQTDYTKSFVKRFSMLGDLTMDSGGNVWVNSRNNQVSRILSDGTQSDFIIGNPENAYDYVQDFGGIAGDLDGNLWIINNTESVINFFDTVNPVQTPIQKISNTILPEILITNSEEGSLSYYMTIGDFTGIRWALKNRAYVSTEPRVVEGMSNLFTIRSSAPGLVKKNENYDLSDTIQSYILQESLINSNVLFDNFFEPILNGDNKSVNQLGKVIYERITNYVDNISDIDKCNLQSLKSMYQMLGADFENILYTLPPSIKRVVDILSVKKCLLYGSKNLISTIFLLSSFEYNPLSNLGPEIDIEKGYFTPGLPIVTYELFSKKYNLVQCTLVNEPDAVAFQPYPLSAINYFWGWGLIIGNKNQKYDEIKNYYKFYEFVPTNNKELYDGVIDFNDELTTVKPTLSSYDQWVGFGREMDYIIGANLYQNLDYTSNV